MASSAPVSLIPVDQAVLTSFQKRFQQVFNCKCAYINSFDKTKVLDRIFGEGQPLTYPYAYFEIQSISANKDWYSTQLMVRKGLIAIVDSNSTVQKVRVLPTNFEINITYVTNVFESVDQGSVTAFARRWLLAYRGGYLKSTINYGKLSLNIGATLSENVAIPQLENIVESESSYKLSTSITLHGYVSEPILSTGGKVNTVNVKSSIGGTNLKLSNSQIFTFPPKN